MPDQHFIGFFPAGAAANLDRHGVPALRSNRIDQGAAILLGQRLAMAGIAMPGRTIFGAHRSKVAVCRWRRSGRGQPTIEVLHPRTTDLARFAGAGQSAPLDPHDPHNQNLWLIEATRP